MPDPRPALLLVRYLVPHAGHEPRTKLPPPKPEAVELASAGLYKVVGDHGEAAGAAVAAGRGGAVPEGGGMTNWREALRAVRDHLEAERAETATSPQERAGCPFGNTPHSSEQDARAGCQKSAGRTSP